jgi:hypothetical protein
MMNLRLVPIALDMQLIKLYASDLNNFLLLHLLACSEDSNFLAELPTPHTSFGVSVPLREQGLLLEKI